MLIEIRALTRYQITDKNKGIKIIIISIFIVIFRSNNYFFKHQKQIIKLKFNSNIRKDRKKSFFFLHLRFTEEEEKV